MSVLMAIDPGVSTGVAIKLEGTYHTSTITDATELWDMIAQFRPEKLAFETFSRNGQIDANMIYTMELVGSLKCLCHVLHLEAHPQYPQYRKAFQLDARSILHKQRGSAITPHEHDALAHLLRLEYDLTHPKKESAK